MKVCSKCKLEKEEDDFGKQTQKKDGLRPECKQCRISSSKEYYHKNTNRIKEGSKAWQNKNKDARITYLKEYNIKNCEKIKSRRKDYYLKNSDKIRAYQRESSSEKRNYGVEYRLKNSDKIKVSQKKYRQENRNAIKAVVSLYIKNNSTKIGLQHRQYMKKCISNLTEGYVRARLKASGFSNDQINANPELIIIKKTIIKIKRHVRENKRQKSQPAG